MDTHLHGNFRMPRKTKMDDGGGWRHGRAFDSWLPASPCLTETPFALSPGLLPSELHILDCPSNYAMRFASPRARHLESVRLAFHQETGGRWVRTGELRRAILADSRRIPRQTMWKLRIWELVLLPFSLSVHPLGSLPVSILSMVWVAWFEDSCTKWSSILAFQDPWLKDSCTRWISALKSQDPILKTAALDRSQSQHSRIHVLGQPLYWGST